MTQLADLAIPFPDKYIEHVQGNPFVAHHVINQRLLSVIGPFDFELVQVIRGDIPAVASNPNGNSQRAKRGTPPLVGVVVGAVFRLHCEIDGRGTIVEEIGDVGDVHNWPHDGARLKDAASDALKRCAMRLGLGLHLWAQEHYFLDGLLSSAQGEQQQDTGPQGRVGKRVPAVPVQTPAAGLGSPGPVAGPAPDGSGPPGSSGGPDPEQARTGPAPGSGANEESSSLGLFRSICKTYGIKGTRAIELLNDNGWALPVKWQEWQQVVAGWSHTQVMSAANTLEKALEAEFNSAEPQDAA
jgi:hypothetical protein